MIQYIHKKKEKKKFIDHHNTSVKNVHTERTMSGGKGVISSDPPLNPLGTATKKKTTKNKQKNNNKNLKSPKLWLRSFQAAAKRPNTSCPQGRAELSSLLSPSFSLFVLLPLLIV